ncbi:MAG: chemotaxis protein CheV [Candidatus Kuenenia sp.]|nr:chemotaxis protein CheV [Candidatus Kuenenia hertensis]
MGKQQILLESGTNEMELLEFLIGGQSFGVNVAKVQSIVQYDPKTVTKVATAPPAMMGMMLHRGKTIPLIDLANALDMNKKKDADANSTSVVIVTEFNNSINSFLVDGVNRIHRLCWDAFVPISNVINISGLGIIGSVHINDTEVMVVDLEHILSRIFPQLAIGEAASEIFQIEKKHGREEVCIFFAEDSKTIRDNVVRVLCSAGYNKLRVFENGQKALDVLMGMRDKVKAEDSFAVELPNVLISDIEMPELDGLTLCKSLKSDSILRNISVIMFSSLINDQMIMKCESVGADSYITKPEMNKLINMLDERCLKKEK